MSVARSASATTSLPKPATLTPARTGRSSADKLPPPAGRAFAPSFVLLAKLLSPPFSARRTDGRHPTGLRALTQSGEHFQAGITISGLHADLFLVGENRFDGVAPRAP